MSQQKINTSALESSETCKKDIYVVGQLVYTNLYGRGTGVIYAIHGEQMPETVKSVYSVMVSGGSAKFDIVFKSGHIVKSLPECILRGVQWTVYDEIVSSEEVEKILSIAEETVNKQHEDARREKDAFTAEVERLKTAPEYEHLSQVDEGIKQVTKNIRIELKRAFPGIKFSVRKDGYSSIDISSFWGAGRI